MTLGTILLDHPDPDPHRRDPELAIFTWMGLCAIRGSRSCGGYPHNPRTHEPPLTWVWGRWRVQNRNCWQLRAKRTVRFVANPGRSVARLPVT
jgi:hypothetical protein